ncbi:nucleoside phosphorylase domain-containing protein [Aspergillus karnatakaensis]|uniref:nucleoside phosphorylase domain-containing protein n=1 Tax=Aspergillus karnatakaensis TaxID=1810916 RepID=UPI003CCE4E08
MQMDWTHGDYTIAWICALPLEMAAAKLMLERIHPLLSQPQTDHNVYTLGSISGHNIVIACLPSGVYGTTSAAIVLDQMLPTFPCLRFGLMVGVGGGVPNPSKYDIRLGDVVVSMPTSGATVGGVIQYDYGKALHNGSFQQTGSLNKPPRFLLTAISQMRSEDLLGDVPSRIAELISGILESREPRVRDQFARPDQDWLFKPGYYHYQREDTDCSACDQAHLEVRKPRQSKKPIVYYGLIASANQVMKNPIRRDTLAQEMDILCFEMEAAGLMDQLPCLVVRGISDYCDSHKHKDWQGYAALTAAAYAKMLLDVVPSRHRKDPAQHGPLLWVSGTPGCGKSFIAQNIIAALQERFPHLGLLVGFTKRSAWQLRKL